jgi:hypothetical protein
LLTAGINSQSNTKAVNLGTITGTICCFVVGLKGIYINKIQGLLKVKVKLLLRFFLTEHHAMKAYWGSAGVSPLNLLPLH